MVNSGIDLAQFHVHLDLFKTWDVKRDIRTGRQLKLCPLQRSSADWSAAKRPMPPGKVVSSTGFEPVTH